MVNDEISVSAAAVPLYSRQCRRCLLAICKPLKMRLFGQQIGDDMVTVGNIRAGQIISVIPVAADYYEFKFGFGTGVY